MKIDHMWMDFSLRQLGVEITLNKSIPKKERFIDFVNAYVGSLLDDAVLC